MSKSHPPADPSPDPPAEAGPPHLSELQRRRALEQAVAALAETSSELSLLDAVDAILESAPAATLLPVLVKYLETPSSQLRGGLVRLAQLLPHDETVAALQRAAGNRTNAPQARATAAMILERFLNQALSPGVLADLQGAEGAAEQSLREAVAEGRTNRRILLEYVTQMQEYDEQIAHQVLFALDKAAAADQVELLRLLAQEPRLPVSRAALQRLEGHAAFDDGALRALHTMQFCLPPAQVQPIARALRKLQFRGRAWHPPASIGMRALVSPAGRAGALWLIVAANRALGAAEESRTGFFLEMLLHPEQGILQIWSDDRADLTFLPAPAPPGTLVLMPTEPDRRGAWLELPFDVGRALVNLALVAHWEGRATQELDNEWRLANDRLWEFAPPVLEPGMAALFVRPGQAPALADAGPLLAALHGARSLLARFLPVAIPLATMPELDAKLPPEQLAHLLARELAESSEGATVKGGLAAGLWMDAILLQCTGRGDAARAAWRLSGAMLLWPLEKNPLLLSEITASVRAARPAH